MAKQNLRSGVVTGASHEIGASVAERLSRDGFAVAINGNRLQERHV